MKDSVDGRSGEMIKMTGQIEVQPIVTEGPGLKPVEIGNGDEQQAVWGNQASNFGDDGPWVFHVFEAVPKGNAVERTLSSTFIEGAEDCQSVALVDCGV